MAGIGPVRTRDLAADTAAVRARHRSRHGAPAGRAARSTRLAVIACRQGQHARSSTHVVRKDLPRRDTGCTTTILWSRRAFSLAAAWTGGAGNNQMETS